MSKVVFKANDAGIQKLLKGQPMQKILGELAQKKASQAGYGYVFDVHVHSKRAVANIAPSTKKAMQDNLDNNTLLKVIGG